MSERVFQKLEELLKQNKAAYRVLEHEPSGLSTEVSKVREKLTGIPSEQLMRMAVKAMILKSHDAFFQFNLAADKRIDFSNVKKLLGRPVQFATPEEIKSLADCAVGEVPPFGNLFDVPVYADPSIDTDEILFNAGVLTKTIFMKREDWIRIVQPTIVQFSK